MADRPSRPSARTASAGQSPRRSAFFRGDAGMRRTDEELERQKQRAEERKNSTNKPFRFFVPVGETRQVIVCDDKPDFFMYEHALKDSEGRWGRVHTGCIKEDQNCPVCQSSGKESYYAMMLTVVDLTPFETRDGDTVEFSRKLLVVKPAQQKKFLRFFNKEGSLRGALFDMTRDGDKDSSIGNDIEFVEFVPEEEMATYVRSWKDKDGKKHTEACHEPFVYEDLFEEPTYEKLAAIVGASPMPGSRAAERHAHGEDAPARGSRSAARTPPRTSRPARDADGWDDDDADQRAYGDDEPPARGRRGRPAAEAEDSPPQRRGRPARPDAEDAEDAPRVRRPARQAAEPDDVDSPPPSRGRRPAPQDDPEERPAARGRRPAASRRQKADDEWGDDIPF